MDGILIVDKVQGMTSHDVVDFIRKKYALPKVGHAGTLDPMATGVLVILIGRMTKCSSKFINDDKGYLASMILGTASTTGDSEGVLKVLDVNLNYNREDVEKVLKSFLGDISQLPPLYSAVKYNGRKLYEYARRGIEVERRPRRVTIKSIELLEFELPKVSFEIVCSKGTYIRQLCTDIGDKLGCSAHLSNLRRIRSGEFTLKDAITMDELNSISYLELERKLIDIKCRSSTG